MSSNLAVCVETCWMTGQVSHHIFQGGKTEILELDLKGGLKKWIEKLLKVHKNKAKCGLQNKDIFAKLNPFGSDRFAYK